jgi:predicted phosphodiesterase
MGEWTKGPTYSFTTFANRESKRVSFSLITDTHEHVNWIKKYMHIIDWAKTDFLVDDGDIVNYVQNTHQLFAKAITPITKPLNHSKPLLYAIGNHENRGPYARSLYKYLPPIHEGKYYYAGNDGPMHFIVLDTGEDKPDTTNVYAGLNDFKDYRSQEYQWFKKHVKTSKTLRKAPFRIIFMHQPGWGFTGGKNQKWTELANRANIDLVLAGHWHRFAWFKPGQFHGNDYYLLVLGQRQVENVKVTDKFINIEVKNMDNKLVFSARIDSKGNLRKHYIAPKLKKREKKMLQKM